MKKSLGDRMKGYENVNRNYLMRRTPVIIRLDGKAFHTYTRKCDKPYDSFLHIVRKQVMQELCEQIQGCIVGYSQSDEISLVLKDWQAFTTCAWFDNNIQKIVSVSASMCTMIWNEWVHCLTDGEYNKLKPNALFDSRTFNLPKEEVVNYLIWRQKDWERNSIQMLAQSKYSQKQLNGLSCPELITKVENEHGIVWGNLEPWKKQGEIWISGSGLVDNFIFKERRKEIEDILNKEDQ